MKVLFTQLVENIKEEIGEVLSKTTESSTPSNIIDPLFAELYVGPLINVPLLEPTIFLHVVDPEIYELGFAASKYNTKPSVTIFGATVPAIV